MKNWTEKDGNITYWWMQYEETDKEFQILVENYKESLLKPVITFTELNYNLGWLDEYDRIEKFPNNNDPDLHRTED